MGIPKKTIITLLASSLLIVPMQITWPDTKVNPKVNIEDILNSRIDNEYDNDTFLVDYSNMSISKIFESVFQLESIVQLKYKVDSSNILLQSKNSGTATTISESNILTWAIEKSDKYKYDRKVLEARLEDIKTNKVKERIFFYTANHIVDAPNLDEVELPQLPPSAKLDKININPYAIHRNRLVNLDIVLSNKTLDAALLESKDKDLVLPVFPYKIGDSDKLKIANFLYIFGNPNILGIDLGTGNVSKTYSPVAIIGENKNDYFSIKYGLNFGDSGGPVIAILDGNFELVGINQAKIDNEDQAVQMMGIAVKINPHMNFIVKELYFKK